ncbi:Chorismate synthase, partial [Metarhizium brunneum ARSEF 3297]
MSAFSSSNSPHHPTRQTSTASIAQHVHLRTLLPVTTAGESHGKSVSCIVDNCPPGLALVEDDIQPQLNRRRPGQSAITTPRNGKDRVTIHSGTEFGRSAP